MRLDRTLLAHLTADDLRRVHQSDGSGFPDDARLKHVGAVKLSAIYTAPNVFQPRDETEYPHEVHAHVKRLADTIKRGTKLDRILVFPVQGKRLAIDGHLRLRAYELAGLGADTMVRVQHVLSLDEALMLSASANSKDKLRLTGNAKSERAWFLSKENARRNPAPWTQAQIATATDRSLRLVKFMAHVLKTNEQEFGFDPRGEASWKAVLAKRSGKEPWTEEQADELILKHAANWRRAGKLPDSQPEVAAEGFVKAYQRVAREVAEILSDGFE